MVIESRNYPVLIVMRLGIDKRSAEYAKRNNIRFILLNLCQERFNIRYGLDGSGIKFVLVSKPLLDDKSVTGAVDLLVRNAINFPVYGKTVPHHLRHIRLQLRRVFIQESIHRLNGSFAYQLLRLQHVSGPENVELLTRCKHGVHLLHIVPDGDRHQLDGGVDLFLHNLVNFLLDLRLVSLKLRQRIIPGQLDRLQLPGISRIRRCALHNFCTVAFRTARPVTVAVAVIVAAAAG
ncbi:hypothetical protein D3C75_853860 [compost metagenome]